MKIGAIVLARLDSSRLPGKALLPVAGRPLLGRVADIALATPGVNCYILATTTRQCDDSLAKYATTLGLSVFRGDTEDVAGRFLNAMDNFGCDAALRLNGDSPFNRPTLLGSAISAFRSGEWDLVTNLPGRSYPFGVSSEVIGRMALATAHTAMTQALDREHVTRHFYENEAQFRILRLPSATNGLAGMQLAVDDAADLAQAEWLATRLGERLLDADLAELVVLARQYRAARAAGVHP